MTNRTYFNNEIKNIILNELVKAQTEIIVAVAWFNDKDLFDVLLKKAEEGKLVNLLISNDPANFDNTNNLNFELLINCGGNVNRLITENALMHHKFCIIDNHTLITGSYNWTYSAHFHNLENIIIIENDIKLCEIFKSEYNRILNNYFQYIKDFDNLLLQLIKKAEELKKQNLEGRLDPNWILKILEQKQNQLFLTTGENDNNEKENNEDKINSTLNDWWAKIPTDWQRFFNEKFVNNGRSLQKPTNEALKFISELEEINCSSYFSKTYNERKKVDEYTYYVTNIDGLQNLNKLKKLTLRANNFSQHSLTALNEMQNLEYLNLSSNQITAIPLNCKLNKIKELNLSNNKLNSFDFLNYFPELEILHCYGNNITGVQGIEKAKKLRLILMNKINYELMYINPKLNQLGFEKRDFDNSIIVKLERE